MKILLVVDQFEDGGAARVACTMCNEFNARGYDIQVVSSSKRESVKYDLEKEIPLLYAPFRPARRDGLSRFLAMFVTAKYIRKHLKTVRPDVVIAIQANSFIRSWIANRHLNYPLIVADHTSFARKMDFINTYTRHHLYKYADGISILTKRDEKLLGEKYPQKVVIYNPLTWPLLKGATCRNKTVLAAGRFEIWRIKGFDLLLTVWGDLAKSFPDWTLQIAGTGTEEDIATIKALIKNNGVQDRVELLGQVSDMKTLYSKTGIFALSSRVEGMPMVLLEAMSQGCPCVAFDVGGASSEMLQDGGGIVVKDGDVEGFQSALWELMEHEDQRLSMSDDAVLSAGHFTVDIFMDKWISLINKTIHKQ